VTACSRSIFPGSVADATMFWTVICGFVFPVSIFLLRSSLTILWTASCACFSLFAPVETIFPELKISVAVFGFSSLNTRPGNWSGLYSTFSKVLTIWFRSIFWSRITDATTFWISTIGFSGGFSACVCIFPSL